MAIEHLEWKDDQDRRLRIFLRQFERMQHNSERYRMMFDEFFVSNPHAKREAARFIEGSHINGDSPDDPPEIIEVGSSDGSASSSSSLLEITETESRYPPTRSNLDPSDPVERSRLRAQSSEVIAIDSSSPSCISDASPRLTARAESERSSGTGNSSTHETAGLPIPTSSQSGILLLSSQLVEKRSLSHCVMFLQNLEYQFLVEAHKLVRQHSKYERVIEEEQPITIGICAKRRRLTITDHCEVVDQEREAHRSSRPEITDGEIERNLILLRWERVRDSIVRLVTTGFKIIQVRKIVVQKIVESTAEMP